MNPRVHTSREWSQTRWWVTVVGVMGLQVGFLFALGERTPPTPRLVGARQTLHLTDTRTELQELLDPTLFARPHARDFSATSWLPVVRPAFPVFRWTEPVRPLELPIAQLGSVLAEFLHTNVVRLDGREIRPVPELSAPETLEVAEAIPAKSQLIVTGPLAGRTLLNPPALAARPAEDLLTNTLIQVQVDTSGCVLSAIQLGAERLSGGSGSAAADSLALAVARELRFAPAAGNGWLASPATQLTRGVVIFKWRTERATNGVPTSGTSP